MPQQIKNVVFDLGGVFVDWDPRVVYRKIFKTEAEVEYFLTRVCNYEWNEKQDMGRSFTEGENELIPKFPHFEKEIRLYNLKWHEMFRGPIYGTIELLERLYQSKLYRLLALSNWSREKFIYAEENFLFLKQFEGIVVSGRVGLVKPKPEIYQYLCQQYKIVPQESVFIDDRLENIETAQHLGFLGIHFTKPEDLELKLQILGIL